MSKPMYGSIIQKKDDKPSCTDKKLVLALRDGKPGNDTPKPDEQFFFSRKRGISTLNCIGLGLAAGLAAGTFVFGGSLVTSGIVAASAAASYYMSANGPIPAGSRPGGASYEGASGHFPGMFSSSSEEISIDELKATFVKHDTDMDNKINFLELQEVLNSLGVKPSKEDIMKVYKTATGKVDLVPVSMDTFLYMFGIKSEETEEEGYTPSRLNRIFEKYDSDKDGNLSYQELVAALNELELNFDSADVENSYKSATGRSKLGSINCREFFKIFDLDV